MSPTAAPTASSSSDTCSALTWKVTNCSVCASFGTICVSRDREHAERDRRAEHAGEDALGDERHADVHVGRADELHDRDLAPAREHGQPDRVRDDDRRGIDEQRDQRDPDAAEHVATL
jgi:hypothetical protein